MTSRAVYSSLVAKCGVEGLAVRPCQHRSGTLKRRMYPLSIIPQRSKTLLTECGVFQPYRVVDRREQQVEHLSCLHKDAEESITRVETGAAYFPSSYIKLCLQS